MFSKKNDHTEIIKEILREVRRIELSTQRNVNSTFSGSYSSAFKGSGMQFADTRPYVAGDDVRHIAWNISARMPQQTHVKRFEEERELHVMVAMDVSGSRIYGGEQASVGRRSVQVAAALAFSALQNSDLVGAMFFSENVEQMFPFKKGKGHVLRLIREMIAYKPERRGTALSPLFETVQKRIRQRSVVFIISDFIAPLPRKQLLRICSQKHEIVAINIRDPFEAYLPSSGLIQIHDSETGQQTIVDLGLPGAKAELEKKINDQREALRKTFFQAGISYLELASPEDDMHELTKFFIERKGRQGFARAGV